MPFPLTRVLPHQRQPPSLPSHLCVQNVMFSISYTLLFFPCAGDWLEEEPESSKALNKLLCRPLNHLWNVSVREGWGACTQVGGKGGG